MKRFLWVVPYMGLLLTGCGIGGYSMTGMVLEKDLKSIKPYGQQWVKEGWTVDQRRRDAWDCGALRHSDGADNVYFSREQVKAEMQPGEPNELLAASRLKRPWRECMKTKGYVFSRTGVWPVPTEPDKK